MAIRIDIWEWFQSGNMPENGLIDLSDDAAQHRFFNKQIEEYGYDQVEACKALKFAISRKEVLLQWRGHVPLEYCDVVDDINESFAPG